MQTFRNASLKAELDKKEMVCSKSKPKALTIQPKIPGRTSGKWANGNGLFPVWKTFNCSLGIFQ